MNIIGKKYWYFLFSGLVIIPGVISLFLFGLRLSIDFTGGTLLELKVKSSTSAEATADKEKLKVEKEEIKRIVDEQGIEVGSIQVSGENTYLLRMKPIEQEQNEKIKKALGDKFGQIEELRFETVGPLIGSELTQKALWAIGIASAAIVLYISWAFRKVPKPASSWRFGICAIVALLHDVLVVVGIFSLLSHFLKVEIDSLFVTALLTIIGFSVHDTIVVFDRIRENLKKMVGISFAQIVNDSILQTLNRSLNTSLTVVFVLSALLLFGGQTLRWFIVALLVGIVSGTYSSIFNASPLLVVWHEWSQRRAHSSTRKV